MNSTQIALPELVELLTKRREAGVEYPYVTNAEVRFSLNGDKSKWPGDVSITSAHTYGEREFYGALKKADGGLVPMRSCPPEVIERLGQMQEKGVRQAIIEYGLRAGVCGFCGRALTTPQSLSAGYGPICARMHGLPWSTKQTLDHTASNEATDLSLSYAD